VEKSPHDPTFKRRSPPSLTGLIVVGEPPLFLGSSIFFAIRDAIIAARKDSGVHDLLNLISPATPERIRLGCEDEIVKRCIVKPKEGEKSFFVVI
jgi:xanthine dehydrogenase/oxidase